MLPDARASTSPSSIVITGAGTSNEHDKTISPYAKHERSSIAIYPLLFGGNILAEYLKTCRQTGIHSTYVESAQHVMKEVGKPLKPAAQQMTARLFCRSAATISASYHFPLTPIWLAGLDTVTLTAFENYRM
jgi:hypothetical protein